MRGKRGQETKVILDEYLWDRYFGFIFLTMLGELDWEG